MNNIKLNLKSLDSNLTKQGDLYLIDNELYILSCIGGDKYIFVGLKDGIRWDEIFECKDENMTVDNIIAIIRKDDSDYNKSLVVYIGNKTIVVRE